MGNCPPTRPSSSFSPGQYESSLVQWLENHFSWLLSATFTQYKEIMMTYIMDQTHKIITLNNFYFVSYNVDLCVEFDLAFPGASLIDEFPSINTWQECGKYLICISWNKWFNDVDSLWLLLHAIENSKIQGIKNKMIVILLLKRYYYLISAELCSSNPNCKYWTLRPDKSNGMCRLKDEINRPKRITGAVSGWIDCPAGRKRTIGA